jgi:hypothetical protein
MKTNNAGDGKIGFMPTVKRYRAKAAEYRELQKTAQLPSEARNYRNLEHSYITLADNAQWMADNRDKLNCSAADDNWYGNILRPRQETPQETTQASGQGSDQDPSQEKHVDEQTTRGCLATVAPVPSREVLTKIEQLFDDACSNGGLLQTATLRGPLTRFLKKHKDDDFR